MSPPGDLIRLRVPCGFELDYRDNPMMAMNDFVSQYRKAFSVIATTKLKQRLGSMATKYADRRSLGICDKPNSITNPREQAAKEMQKLVTTSPLHRYGSSVTFFMVENRLLLVVNCDQVKWTTMILAHPDISDFCYWDDEEKPRGVCIGAWAERRRLWLKTQGPIGEIGFETSLLKNGSIALPPFDKWIISPRNQRVKTMTHLLIDTSTSIIGTRKEIEATASYKKRERYVKSVLPTYPDFRDTGVPDVA